MPGFGLAPARGPLHDDFQQGLALKVVAFNVGIGIVAVCATAQNRALAVNLAPLGVSDSEVRRNISWDRMALNEPSLSWRGSYW